MGLEALVAALGRPGRQAMTRSVLSAFVGLGTLVAFAWAQESQPTPEPVLPPVEQKLEPVLEGPEVMPPERTSARVRILAAPGGGLRGSPATGALAGVRAISLEEGEAHLLINGAERTLRPGDALGSGIVKSVGGDRVVLVRPEGVDPEAGKSIVIVRFGADGDPRVLVISGKDGKAVVAPEVK